ncbi:unnamed protein product [Candida verbasci]|uniref:Biogenesis of lysosome-related organelles complex 1 subunit CNL1 n=1 Tax=Candida verbasci TaxID=1227364 RepID=A0A9W4TWG1_9ASCO|nr:unnamed protein product [Candida verbasci]
MNEDERDNSIDDVGVGDGNNSTESLEDADPLELRQLSLSYDYLMYKIKDHIQQLTDQTYESIKQKQQIIFTDYFENQLKLSNNYKEIDDMLKICNQLESEFLKLDQLELFINDFKLRIDNLEKEFERL